MVTFILLSLVGLIFLGAVVVLIPLAGLLLLAIFVISYSKIRDSTDPNLFMYIFILTAPGAINGIISLFVPSFLLFSGLFGIIVSYLILSGRDFF